MKGKKMKIIKRTIYALITLLIMALLAISALIFFVDPNHYRTAIEALARDKANISLEMKGDLKWSFYPWLGISVGKTNIAALSDIKEPVASVESMEFSLKLIPLIQGDFEIDRLLVDGLQINIEKRSDGSSNIDGFFNTQRQSSQSTPQNTSTDSVAKTDLPDNTKNQHHKRYLNIRLIEVQNSQFLLSDAQKQVIISGDNIHFSIHNIDAESPYFFVEQLQFIEGNFNYLNSRTEQTFNYQSIQFKVANLLLNQRVTDQLRQYYWGIDSAEILEGDIVFKDHKSGKQWALHPGEITMDKSFASTFNEHRSSPWLIEALNVHGLDLSYQTSNAAAPITLNNTELAVTNLQPATAAKFNFSGIFQQGDAPSIDLKVASMLSIDRHDLAFKFTQTDLSAIQQAPSQSPITAEIHSDINLNIGQEKVIFSPLILKLNDEQLSGDITLTNFEKPVISVQMTGDSINLNPWLKDNNTPLTSPAHVSNTPHSSTEKANNSQQNNRNIFAPFRDLSVNFDLSLKTLLFQEYRFTNPHIKGDLSNEKLTLSHISADLLGGKINGTMRIDGQKPTPIINTHLNAEALPLQNLFKVANKDFPVTGNLFLTGDFASRGTEVATLTQQLSGSVEFRVQQGQLLGVDYQALACEGIASIQKVAFSKTQNLQSTPFTELKGTASIGNGVLRNQNLTIQIPGLSASGKGTINLNNETLDYQISLIFTEAGTASHQCAIDNYLKGVSIPLRCQGSFNGKNGNLCGLDQNALGTLIVSFAKKTIENEIKSSIKENLPIFNQDQESEKVPDIFKPETLKKAVEGLFKL